MKTAESASSIARTLKDATLTLSGASDLLPHLEAESLLAFILGKSRSYLRAWPERRLTPNQQNRFQALVERRLAGEPHAYLTGHKEFWSLPLRVTPDTLIPRPETELLVEHALELIPPPGSGQIADLGTGSGAIAAALARERPGCEVWATELCLDALSVARSNFLSLNLTNIRCSPGNWCAALPENLLFDLIVSNPPYIREHDPHLDRGGLTWEPVSALVSGQDGLMDLRRIAEQAKCHLRPGTWLLLEHGWDQGNQVREILARAGYQGCRTRRDLNRLERVTGGRRP